MMQPIRVLQVVTNMDLGGLENFIMNLYRNVDRSKVQFDFLMHREKESAFDKEIISMGGMIYRLRPMRPLQYFQYQSELKSFLQDHPEYSVIHSHINANSTLILKTAKRLKIPVRISHSHIAATDSNYSFIKNLLKKQLSPLATCRLACSNDAGKYLYGKNSFLLFNNGIDTSKFQFNMTSRRGIRTKLDLSENDILIGNVGRFGPQKNHEFLIRVFNEFHKKHPNSKLVLIGEGALRENIEEQIEDLGILDRVVFTGAIQNSQDYLCAMDLYLFPSLFEGLPLALVEAQCNGLPVLMSDSIPQDAILTDLIHQESLTSPVGDWVDKMDAVLKSTHNKREYYIKDIKAKGFDAAVNAKKIEDLYLNALNEKKI